MSDVVVTSSCVADRGVGASTPNSVGGSPSELSVPDHSALSRKPSIAQVAPESSPAMSALEAELVRGSGRDGLASEEESVSDFDTSPTGVDEKDPNGESST